MVLYCVFFVFVFKLLNSAYAEIQNEDVTIKWRTWRDSITFYIQAKTHGWVAIGFNNEAPLMKGADMVLAGLANNTGYIYDLHDPKGHTRPVLDTRQDYKLIWAQENATHTFVTVRRPFNTTDQNDAHITEKPINLLWAFNDKDAKSGKDFKYHGSHRGVEQVILLTPDVEWKLLNKTEKATTSGPKKN